MFDSFAVEVPPTWDDITDSLDIEDPPYTIARQGGVGALQFSIARHRSGPVPNPTTSDLRDMLFDFGMKSGGGDPKDVVLEEGPPALAAASFLMDDDFVRAWEVSDGNNIAFATYVCAADELGEELMMCEEIVRTIRFEP